MAADLIFDLGPHEGMDTGYFLHLGATVVAVEADARMVAGLQERFADAVADGRLVVHHLAVAERPGETVTFHLSEFSWWNSARPEVAHRTGLGSTAVEVPTTTLGELVARHGVPHYCKIDIEGLDPVAIRSLGGERPEYISAESECAGEDAAAVDPLDTLRALVEQGYGRFKLVEQRSLRALEPDVPFFDRLDRPVARARQALYDRRPAAVLYPFAGRLQSLSRAHGYRFVPGSTGPFGEAVAGPWHDADTAERMLLRHRADYFATRDAQPFGFWCDWHAAR